MIITAAAEADIEPAVACLARAFAHDAITGYLLQAGDGYPQRLTRFFTLLMRARVALRMPVLVGREGTAPCAGAMGYDTTRPAWPDAIAQDWDRFEQATPGLTGRMAVYDAIAQRGLPAAPHHYLGVIGVDPALQGRGHGQQMLDAFCQRSDADPLSGGVYLETATPSNVAFYARAGFRETARGPMGDATLWCLFRPRGSR